MARATKLDPQPPVPSSEEIAHAFSVDPRGAIDFFESLGIRVGWNWAADASAARDAAFYVSNVMREDVLLAFKEELASALAQGTSKRVFRQIIIERLRKLGFLGPQTQVTPDGVVDVDVSTPARLDTIFRTNTQTAYNAGRYETQLAMAHVTPVWQYVAVMDSRTRASHAAMNGKAFHAQDPIWQRIYPPCGFNCRCRVRALTPERSAGLEVLDGATFQLPDGFPDEGFGGTPANPMQLLAALSQRATETAQSGARVR